MHVAVAATWNASVEIARLPGPPKTTAAGSTLRSTSACTDPGMAGFGAVLTLNMVEKDHGQCYAMQRMHFSACGS